MDRRKFINKRSLLKNVSRTDAPSSINSQLQHSSIPDESVHDESSPIRKRKVSLLSSDNDNAKTEEASINIRRIKKRQRISSNNAGHTIAIQEQCSTSKLTSSTKPLESQELTQQKDGRKGLTSKSVVADCPQSRDEFIDFLEASGITLESMGKYKLNIEPSSIAQRMRTVLASDGQFKKIEILRSFERYIQNEDNLQSIINDFDIPPQYDKFNSLNSFSIVTVLLQIPELQAEILQCLLRKLNECILIADSMEKLPWACLLLQQLRFLEILVDSNSLIKSLEELLDSSPVWFQSVLILLLPDIAPDSEHHAIFRIVGKLIDENFELINVILDCITSLTLTQGCMDEYRNKVLALLKKNLKPNVLPAIVRFLLTDCTNADAYVKILTALRSVDMQPLVGDNLDDCYKCQADVITALKMSLLLSKEMIQATLTVTKSVTQDPKPLDIILLILLSGMGGVRRKNCEIILKSHIRTGVYRISLLHMLYNDYKEIVRDLQATVLQIASYLLNAEERVFIDFAIEWFRLQFRSQAQDVYKQREIIEKLILLVGCNDRSGKNALQVLYAISRKDAERHLLQVHSNHLRILLEKMDNLDLEEVGMLNDLLHALCLNSHSSSDPLRDDLFMLLQKQLSNVKPLIKGKGILGSVMAIKHLATVRDTSHAAYKLFGRVTAATKGCPRSQALFYDELSDALAQTENIENDFLEIVAKDIEQEFVNIHMIDKSAYRGELVPKFGLNSDKECSQDCLVHFNHQKYGAAVPITFKLLKTCYLKLCGNDSLEDINALLESPVLMPENINIPEPYVLDSMINCINWFRELIAGFVTQKCPLLRKQLLRRLDHLMDLQGELNNLLAISDAKYHPLPCYFHYFPIPQFLRMEKRVTRTGIKDKTINTLEKEPWDVNIKVYTKNPAYFRKFDAKLGHLLDIDMSLPSSEPISHGISISQLCFVVKELLVMLENEPNEMIMKDLIQLLPNICIKLENFVTHLRETDNAQSREATNLLLDLLTGIFNWKGFHTATYNNLLRDGLRILASMLDKKNATLISSKELVNESCKYIDSLSDIATRISLAIALIGTGKSLMKHSQSYMQQYKGKHASIALGFLSLQWSDDKHAGPEYKNSITLLLNNWIDNEPDPLHTIAELLEWLPDEVAKLQKSQDTIDRLPSINRGNFHLVYKKIFDGIIKGVKVASSTSDTTTKRLEIWQDVSKSVERTVKICKALKTKRNVLIFLRYMPTIVRLFLSTGMPVLERSLKYQAGDVTGILKAMQNGTRHLHAVCCDCTERRDVTLTKYIPIAKAALEKLVFSVKGMLVLNNSAAAFWMGNLINKNLDGIKIGSDPSSGSLSTLEENAVSLDANSDNLTHLSSEILDSESDDENAEECDDNDKSDTSDNDCGADDRSRV